MTEIVDLQTDKEMIEDSSAARVKCNLEAWTSPRDFDLAVTILKLVTCGHLGR